MARLLGGFLLFVLFLAAVKIAIVLILLAGLIFRTKETIGLIIVLAILAGFSAHPAITVGIIALFAAIEIYTAKPKPKETTADAIPQLTDDSTT